MSPRAKIDTRRQDTRERVLDAAIGLFAELGYRKVTVREICRKAKANVAAVNYHFGDKPHLYREVLAQAVDAMRATTDAAREAAEGLPPDERLRSYLHIFLRRLLGAETDTRLHRLVIREITEPTPAFDTVVDRGIRPRVEYLAQIVSELTGEAADDERVLHAVASVQAQCVLAKPNPVTRRLWPALWGPGMDIDRIADHIADFSLAGIRGIGRPPVTARPRPRAAARPTPQDARVDG